MPLNPLGVNVLVRTSATITDGTAFDLPTRLKCINMRISLVNACRRGVTNGQFLCGLQPPCYLALPFPRPPRGRSRRVPRHRTHSFWCARLRQPSDDTAYSHRSPFTSAQQPEHDQPDSVPSANYVRTTQFATACPWYRT
ncbi:unnamed protein product [Sphacelaria rigidula]